MTFRRLSVAVALIALTGCAQAPAIVAPAGASVSVFHKAAPVSEAAFLDALKQAKIQLSDEQKAIIEAERTVKPSGLMAPRPAEKLSAEQNLEVHFRKHRGEFGSKTAEEYLAQGVAAGRGERGAMRLFFDTTSFKKGYQTHVVRWNPKNLDFCAFRTDGAMTTYYKNKVKPGRFIELPTD